MLLHPENGVLAEFLGNHVILFPFSNNLHDTLRIKHNNSREILGIFLLVHYITVFHEALCAISRPYNI